MPSGYASADEASFTKQIADRLSRELSGLRVEIAGPLTLKIDQTDGAHILQANLDRIFAFCSKAAEQCDAATSQYIAGVSGAVKDRIRPIEPSMIRLNVRPRKGLESAQQHLPPDAPRIVLRPFAGDLALTAVLDFPTAIVLGFSLIERTLAGRFAFVGENKTATEKSETLLKKATERGWLSEGELQLLDELRKLRNPIVHFRDHLSETRPEVRAALNARTTGQILEEDAKRIIEAMIHALSKTAL